MTANNDIHTCSYYCERPECVRRQRDELFTLVESDTALLRQALEALAGQRGNPDWHTSQQREAAITALRERLGESI